jgi:hypothetical protein
MPQKYSFKDVQGAIADGATFSLGGNNKYAQPITCSFMYREAETGIQWYVEATGTRV